MKKGQIKRLTDLSEDLKLHQEFFIYEAENNTSFYMDAYQRHPSSLGGRYICSDLFKETFSRYTESLDSRSRLSEAIHNSAAVLANEMFLKAIQNTEIKHCIFLSGVPGGGKSFLIQSLALSGAIDKDTMVYEGDISTPTIFAKIEAAKNTGKEIHIIIVNPTLELAQTNAVNRSLEIGRGASCETMARILSKIPMALCDIHKKYPEIDLAIYNKKSNYEIECSYGFENLHDLEYGDYEEILNRLRELRLKILNDIKKKIKKPKIENGDNENKKI